MNNQAPQQNHQQMNPVVRPLMNGSVATSRNNMMVGNNNNRGSSFQVSPSAPPLSDSSSSSGTSSPTRIITTKPSTTIVHNHQPPSNSNNNLYYPNLNNVKNNTTTNVPSSSVLYPKLPEQQFSVNQHLYNIQKQHQRPQPSSKQTPPNNSSSTTSNSNGTKKSKKNDHSSTKVLYDSSTQLISGISSYVKSIPWTNLAKQFNENITQPFSSYVSSAIGNGISIGGNGSSGGDLNTSNNSDPYLYTSHLGHLIWCDFMFLPVTENASNEERLFMVLAYSNGFQIFDVNDPNNVREIITSSADEWDLNKESLSEIISKTMNGTNTTTKITSSNSNVQQDSNNFEQHDDIQHDEENNFSIDESGFVAMNPESQQHKGEHSSLFNLDYVDHEEEQPTITKHTPNIDDLYDRMLDNSDEEEDSFYSRERRYHQPTSTITPSTATTQNTTEVKSATEESNNKPEPLTNNYSEPQEPYYPDFSSIPTSLGPIKMATLLSKPSQKAIKRSEKRSSDQQSYLSYYPMVAVVTETEPNIVHMYSLRYQCFLDDSFKIYCHNPNAEKVTVFQTVSSEDTFIVSDSSGQIHFFDPCTFNLVSQGVCFPSPDNFTKNPSENEVRRKKKNQKKKTDPQAYGGIIAYRKRFVAFASGNEVLNPKLDFTTKINSTLTERSWEVAKKAATGIYMLGDLGLKKVSKYWFEEKKNRSDSESDSNGSNDNTDSDDEMNEDEVSFSSLWSGDVPIELAAFQHTVGTVEIRDLKTNRVLLHFRAHNEPIAAMAFDRTGTLLCTAPISGKYLNVFQILPNCYGINGDCTSTEKNVKLLYRLYRGLTSAHIQDIHFSVNSKWVAACSARGTIHLYAINPTGGPIDPRFHFNGEQENQSSPGEGIVLNVIARIHDPTAGKRTNSLGHPLTQTRSVFQLYALPEIKAYNTIEATEKFTTEEDLYWERQNATINNENILVTLNCGMLSYYLLKPQLKKKERAAAAENLSRTTIGTASSGVSMVSMSSDRPLYSPDDFELSLSVELLARFDIFQPQFVPQEISFNDQTGQPAGDSYENGDVYFPSQRSKRRLSSITWSSLLGKVGEFDTTYQARYVDEKQDMLSKWISNVELETHSQPSNPLWATGHFKFKTIKSNSDLFEIKTTDNATFKIGDNDYDQISDISKSLYIKVSNPIPVNQAENFLQDDPKPETVKSEVIFKAITTPISSQINNKVPTVKANSILPMPTTRATPVPIINNNKSPIKQRNSPQQVKIVEEPKTINDSIVDGEVSSEEEEELITKTNVPYVGKSFFGENQPQQPMVTAYANPKDLREDNILFFSHMENYFDKEENSDSTGDQVETKNTQSKPIAPVIPNNLGFSLSSSIHQDYFHDDEDPQVELERREHFLKNSLLRESININHLDDDEEEDEKLDEYFN